jgi:hypothetical protein
VYIDLAYQDVSSGERDLHYAAEAAADTQHRFSGCRDASRPSERKGNDDADIN